VSKELMPLTNVNAVDVFQKGGLTELLEKIRAEAVCHVPDLTSDKGRKAIASVAYKVSQSKTYLDDQGKELVADQKKAIKLVDTERNKMRTELDKLRDEVRKPLNDWEEKEKARVFHIESTINETAEAGSHSVDNFMVLSVDAMKDRLAEIESLIQAE